MIRESNNEELINLEAKIHNLAIEKDSSQNVWFLIFYFNLELAKERIALLDYIEEINEKSSEWVKSTSYILLRKHNIIFIS